MLTWLRSDDYPSIAACFASMARYGIHAQEVTRRLLVGSAHIVPNGPAVGSTFEWTDEPIVEVRLDAHGERWMVAVKRATDETAPWDRCAPDDEDEDLAYADGLGEQHRLSGRSA